MSDEQRRMNVASTGQVGTAGGFLDAHFEACQPEYEAMPATSARARVASRHRAMMSARMDTACHGWGRKKAPPKWGFQPRCPLSCELGLLYPQEQTFLVVPPNDRL